MLRLFTALTPFRTRTKRSFRALAWLCLVLLAGLTVLLFATTGGAVSSQFRSWEELSCQPFWVPSNSATTPRFACMSKCGRYYATFALNNEVPSKFETILHFFHARAVDIEIHDWTTDETICRIQKLFALPQSLQVICPCDFLILQDSDGCSSAYEISTGKPVRSFPKSMTGFAITPDGNRVLFADGRVARLESFPGRLPLKTQEYEADGNLTAFFDENGLAKVYRLMRNENSYTIGAELWDLESGQRDWAKDWNYGRREWFGACSWTWTITGTGTSARFDCESLIDGRLIGSHTVYRGEFASSLWPCLSPSKRYCVFPDRRSWLPKRLREWISSQAWLEKASGRIDEYFPIQGPRIEWRLEDFSTGQIMSLKGLEFSKTDWQCVDKETRDLQHNFSPADFFDPKPGFYTLDERGVHVWDLPPRMRWFTPWAWLSLAVTLAMGWVLWKSRTRPVHSPPISSPA
jgi:hypothetical protein